MKSLLLVALIAPMMIFSFTNLSAQGGINLFSKKVDSVVTQKMNSYQIPGLSIGIVKNDSVIYAKGYGVKKYGAKDLITKNSIFHTASVSKLFTAIAIMQLVEKKSLKLEDKLVDIIPNLKSADANIKKITIKNLLNHTSGLGDISNYQWKNNHQADHSLSKYILGLNLKTKSTPNTKYDYSNLGYDILGYVVEKISKENFDDYLKNNLLTINNMQDSDFRYFKITDSLKTSPHTQKGKKIITRKVYPYTREHAPSSTLNASAKDLSQWMISFLNKISEKNSLYQKMLEPSTDAYPHIGLGFQLYDLNGVKAVGHFGGDRGFRSFLMMIPEQQIGLVVLGNCDYNEDFRQEILIPIAKMMLNK